MLKKILVHRHRAAYIFLGVLTIFVYKAYQYEQNQQVLKVYFLDIGQGDAIYMRTPGGRDMLVDGGPSKIVIQRLSEVMPWYDQSIDVVLETHPDADHIGGLPQVLTRYGVGIFIEPGIESQNTIDDEIVRIRKHKNVPALYARRGLRIDFGDGAHFDVLYPDIDPSHFETNRASIVGRMIYGSSSVMLTGDSPKSVEHYLIETDGAQLRSSILKAGHHGSRSSSEREYVATVAPHYAIISAGAGNKYGHPHKEVIDTFIDMGIDIIQTSLRGTIECDIESAALFCK